MIKENLETVERNIADACEKAGRKRGDVTLIAVSKTKPVSDIRQAMECGITVFGENKVQEIKDKKQVDYIFISCGSKEGPDRVRKAVEDLKAAGFNAESYISEGTAHEFLTWRRSLYVMAQKLFK